MNRIVKALVCSLGILASAQAWGASYSIFKDVDLYGRVDQLTPAIREVFGKCGCGPTACINSFVYLQNKYGVNLIPDAVGDDQIAAVIELGTMMGVDPDEGVSDQGFMAGKIEYLNKYGSGRIIMKGQDDEGAGGLTNQVPTWQFIFEELKHCEDVEIGITWWDEETQKFEDGHWITATGFSFEDLEDPDSPDGNGIIDDGESASLNFIDPWGGVPISDGVLSMCDKDDYKAYLSLSYTNVDGETAWGIIDIVVSESVPEPSVLVGLAGMACIGLVIRARRKRRLCV